MKTWNNYVSSKVRGMKVSWNSQKLWKFPKICSKFTREHPCQSVISITLQSQFIEIILRHGFSPVNLLHIFRTPFDKNIYRGLLVNSPERLSCKICFSSSTSKGCSCSPINLNKSLMSVLAISLVEAESDGHMAVIV